MTPPLISVVMPVYNGATTLREATRSIFAQTLGDFELIAVDDGSRDDSRAVLRELAQEDARMRVVELDRNGGLAAALNHGIALARGRYVARQDQDDVSRPERFARQVAWMEAHPDCGLLGTRAEIWIGDAPTGRAHDHPLDDGELKFDLLINNPFVHASMMMRRSTLDRIGPYTTDPARQPPEDYEMWSRFARVARVANLPERLVVYRESPGSMSRVGPNPFLERLLLLSAENIAFWSGLDAPDTDCRDIAALNHAAYERLSPQADPAALAARLGAAADGVARACPQSDLTQRRAQALAVLAHHFRLAKGGAPGAAAQRRPSAQLQPRPPRPEPVRRMRLLLCCEFYHPSRGGVQEVMRQLAERFVADGHEVTVATSYLPERASDIVNGVRIVGFHVSGNRVRGIEGYPQSYVEFLKGFDGDAILIKAAQQWTFDAAWPALDAIKARKVFIPCGFSGLYEPAYRDYFAELPAILEKFDRLIFYAECYRDVDFCRDRGLQRLAFLPNGASERDFARDPEAVDRAALRKRLGIPEHAFAIITVGTPINAKGHAELAQAFGLLDGRGQELCLVLNGQWPTPAVAAAPPATPEASPALASLAPPRRGLARIARNAAATMQAEGVGPFLRRARRFAAHRTAWALRRGAEAIERAEAAAEARAQARRDGPSRTAETVAPARPAPLAAPPPPPPPPPPPTIDDHIEAARAQPGKSVLKTHLERADVIDLFYAADLFVFASNIEYSPLVVFEACAAGLPFLAVPVGNCEEIARWTGGGEICPAHKDERGYTRVEPAVLAARAQALIDDPERRQALGRAGRAAFLDMFNWDAIARRYEAILAGEDGSR